MTPKTMNRLYIPRRQDPKHCEHPGGCNQSTRERKPYCKDHIGHLPYIIDLKARIAEREEEERLVIKYGAKRVDINSTISKDIISYLKQRGATTYARIAKDMFKPRDPMTMASYLDALVKAGLLVKTRHRRNDYGFVVSAA
jgi:predicted transcriptional regulator